MIDKNGMFTRAITYSEFKTNLDEGRKKILAEYESGIIDFFSILDKNAFLKKEFADEVLERMQKLQDTSLHVNSILHNSYTMAGKFEDIDFMNQFQYVAKNEGFDVHNIGEQVIIQFCMGYVYNLEYLKREMLLLIDFKKMGLKKSGKRTLTQLINHLKSHNDFQKNSFMDLLNSEKRNALAHFSFYYYDSKVWLCINGPCDPNPKPLELVDLMKESISINVSSIAFYLIYVSKYRNGISK